MPKTIAEILGTLKPATPTQEIPWDTLPEERGQFVPPPYPGDYIFLLPPKMDGLFDTIEGNAERDQAISLVFDDDNPLQIIAASEPGNQQYVGQNLRVRVNSIPRGRGKDSIKVADTTYLIRVLEPTARPNDLGALVQTFSRQGGKRFLAALTWSAHCSPDRQATMIVEGEDGSQKFEKMVNDDGSARAGCDTRYYQSKWPKDAQGRYTERMVCQCGAVLGPWPGLERFRVPPGGVLAPAGQ